MKILPLVSAFLLAAGTAQAQLVAQLEEFNFSQHGLFPPPGWSEVNLNGGTNLGWEDPSVVPLSGNVLSPFDIAGHDDYASGVTNDFRLVGSSMDLTAFPSARLAFLSTVQYPNFMANHPSSLGDGVSTVEVSTDGGATWTVEWTDMSTTAGFTFGDVDLSSYAGNGDVRLGFHYFGTYAHAWGIDDIFVFDDSGPPPTTPTLVQIGICGQVGSGIGTLNMTPFGGVGFGWSPQVGSSVLNAAACSGTIVQLVSPRILGVVDANFGGSAAFQPLAGIPANACGIVHVQAIDITTCATTNTLAL